jgi:hypothetical protein
LKVLCRYVRWKFPLVSMGGQAEADPGARTPIGDSGNFLFLLNFLLNLQERNSACGDMRWHAVACGGMRWQFLSTLVFKGAFKHLVVKQGPPSVRAEILFSPSLVCTTNGTVPPLCVLRRGTVPLRCVLQNGSKILHGLLSHKNRGIPIPIPPDNF